MRPRTPEQRLDCKLGVWQSVDFGNRIRVLVHVEFDQKFVGIGDPVRREALPISKPSAERSERARNTGMFIDPGGGNQFRGRFDLETGAGSKPPVEHVDQGRSALSAKEVRTLGYPREQEWIKLNCHVELVRKF